MEDLKKSNQLAQARDSLCDYLAQLSKSPPVTGWSLAAEDEDYLIHDILAFRFFSRYLQDKNPADYNTFLFWNEVHDLREIEDVSSRLVRALSIIETFILPTSKTALLLPQDKADALLTYHKKYAGVAEKIKKGGSIRLEDQKKVADSRPLFTSLQTALFDRIKTEYWSKFETSHLWEDFKRLEKKELKKKDRNVIVPPFTSSINDYHVRKSSASPSDLKLNSTDPEFVTSMAFEPENITTKLAIVRTPLDEIMENWEHRTVFDFYVQRVLKCGRAPAVHYLAKLGLEIKDRKVLIQLARALLKMTDDIGFSEETLQTLNRIVQSNAGVMGSLFSPVEQELTNLLPDIIAELQPKLQIYYPKFLCSRPHALYLHLRSLYSQLGGILIWTRDWSIAPGNPEKLQLSLKLCQYFLNFFEQFGVDEFYTKQASKLKRELSENEQRMSIYCTLNVFIQHLFPQIKYHSLNYICTKSPHIRYVISLMKVMLKGLKEDKAQSAVELPFIVKSRLALGIPVAPVHYIGLLEKKHLFKTQQNLGVLTTNCFFQYDQLGVHTAKRKLMFDGIHSVLFARDRKGLLTGPEAPVGFTIDTGKELITFEVPSRRDRALWLLAFHSAREKLVPSQLIPFLYEQLAENFMNEDKLIQEMEAYCMKS